MDSIFNSFRNKWDDLQYSAELLEGFSPPLPLLEEQASSNAGIWIRFTRRGGIRPFYTWYVPAHKENVPLLLFLPGADGRIHSLPACSECDCAFVSPLGYGYPGGIISQHRANLWYNTIAGSSENYTDYILDALCAVKWAFRKEADRKLILTGHSQGGGIALILSALLKDHVITVCADEPMFIGFSFPSIRLHDVLEAVSTNPFAVFSQSQAIENMSFIDPLRFSERLTMPVLLVSGGGDLVSPVEINDLLYDQLPDQEHSRSICIPKRGHGYDVAFFQAMEAFLADCAGLPAHFQIEET